MTWHEYMECKRLEELDPPYYSLLMCAIKRADTKNSYKLQAMWPELYEEVRLRYNAPAGLLPDDPQPAAWALEKYGLAEETE